MARQAQNQANKTFGQAQGVSNTAQGNAGDLYSKLNPIFNAEATNPQGFAPGDINAMNTASQESTGGAIAGAVGQGALEGARNRNAASPAAALDESVRSGMNTNAKNALKVQEDNAMLKQKNQQAGISGLSDLYKGNSNELLASLGLQNQATNTGVSAGKSGWYQNMIDFMNAGSKGAQTGANIYG